MTPLRFAARMRAKQPALSLAGAMATLAIAHRSEIHRIASSSPRRLIAEHRIANNRGWQHREASPSQLWGIAAMAIAHHRGHTLSLNNRLPSQVGLRPKHRIASRRMRKESNLNRFSQLPNTMLAPV